MPRNVLIVGMPRSGTSFTASIFVDRGYYVADDSEGELRKGDEFNPGGYFEASRLVEANANVLSRAGFRHHNTWNFDSISDAQAATVATLEPTEADRQFVKHNDERAPWVWKDPRLCYTLAYWWPMMSSSDTAVLLIRRSASDIHRSFARLGWRGKSLADKADVANREEHHIAMARRTLRDLKIPHCEIRYEDFRDQPELVLTEISDCFDLAIDELDIGFRPELDHSSGRGSVERRFESLSRMLPHSFRGGVKKFAPKYLLRLLFPAKYG